MMETDYLDVLKITRNPCWIRVRLRELEQFSCSAFSIGSLSEPISFGSHNISVEETGRAPLLTNPLMPLVPPSPVHSSTWPNLPLRAFSAPAHVPPSFKSEATMRVD